jgi:hypothetical protein
VAVVHNVRVSVDMVAVYGIMLLPFGTHACTKGALKCIQLYHIKYCILTLEFETNTYYQLQSGEFKKEKNKVYICIVYWCTSHR